MFRPTILPAVTALAICLFSPSAPSQGCPAGEKPIRRSYAGLTVERVQAFLAEDGDGFNVGIYEDGGISTPSGAEWGKVVVTNAPGCETGTCMGSGDFVGVIVTPLAESIATEGPDGGGGERPAFWWFLPALAGAVVGALATLILTKLAGKGSA